MANGRGIVTDFVFKATAEITVKVSAQDEERGRFLILEHLHYADTNFIRSRHYPQDVVANINLTSLRLETEET